jgi:hypothetical protein
LLSLLLSFEEKKTSEFVSIGQKPVASFSVSADTGYG